MRRAALAPMIMSVLLAAGCETGSTSSGYTFTSPPPAITTSAVRPVVYAPPPSTLTRRPYAVPAPRLATSVPAVSPALAAQAPVATPAYTVPASMTTTTLVRAAAAPASSSFAPAAARLSAAPGMTVLATDQTFDRELASAGSLPVIVTFTAKWCGPCHAAAPVLDALAVEQAGRVKVIRIDFDQSPQVVRRYSISAIPAMLVVKSGVVTKRMVGYQSRENLLAAVGN